MPPGLDASANSGPFHSQLGRPYFIEPLALGAALSIIARRVSIAFRRSTGSPSMYADTVPTFDFMRILRDAASHGSASPRNGHLLSSAGDDRPYEHRQAVRPPRSPR